MAIRAATLVFLGFIAVGGPRLAVAQDRPSPPPATVVWQDTVATADIGGHDLQAVPDNQGGLYVVAGTISRRDSRGRILWTVRDMARGERRAMQVSADGDLWLAIVDGWQEVKTITALRFASQDGRILHQHRWSVPLAADASIVRFIPDDTGAMAAMSMTSGMWRLSLLKPGGDNELLPFAWPGTDSTPIDLSPKADGRVILLMSRRDSRLHWLYTISDGAQRMAGRNIPRLTECYPTVRLLANDSLAYMNCVGRLEQYDPATERTVIVGVIHPDEGGGAADLVYVTRDGAYVTKGIWIKRSQPPAEYGKNRKVLSADGQKSWVMTLKVGETLIDSRTVLKIASTCEPRDVCPTLKMRLISYAP